MTNSTGSHHCLLKITNITILKKFLHQCVDELSTHKNAKFSNTMEDIEWSIEEHKIARDYVQTLFKTHIFEGEFAPQFDDLTASHIEEIKTCFNIRKRDIQEAVIKEQLLQNKIPFVESIDWKIKWVIGSSKLSSLSEPLLHVDLNCNTSVNHTCEDSDNKIMNFEMSLSQMDKLIKDLEQIKTQF